MRWIMKQLDCPSEMPAAGPVEMRVYTSISLHKAWFPTACPKAIYWLKGLCVRKKYRSPASFHPCLVIFSSWQFIALMPMPLLPPQLSVSVCGQHTALSALCKQTTVAFWTTQRCAAKLQQNCTLCNPCSGSARTLRSTATLQELEGTHARVWCQDASLVTPLPYCGDRVSQWT